MRGKEREDWIEKIKTYRASGLTASQWCKEQGIAVHRLRYRITQFNKERKENLTKTKWSCISIKDEVEQEENSSSKLKVTIGKSTIEISPGFDLDTFESVVKVLSKC